MNRYILAALIAAVFAGNGKAQLADFAFRVRCETQARPPIVLEDLEWQQGTTPLMRFDVLENGRPKDASADTTVRMIIGPSATSGYYAVATNYLATNTYYLTQWPTIGTNTADAVDGWWYTVYFEAAGRRYWTGNGRLDIIETTSTDPDGLIWQPVISVAETDPIWGAVSNALLSATSSWWTAFGWGDHAVAGYLTDETDPIWSAVSNTVTGNALLGATAHGWGNHGAAGYDAYWSLVLGDPEVIQPRGFFTNATIDAARFVGDGSGLTGVITAETDPIWSAVSNTVTQGAALGATALQAETDPIWSAVSNAVVRTNESARQLDWTLADIRIASALYNDSPVTRLDLYDAIQEFATTVLYGDTNAHPTLAGYSSLVSAGDLPTAQEFEIALPGNTLVEVGRFASTNATDFIMASKSFGRFWMSKATPNRLIRARMSTAWTNDVTGDNAIFDTSAWQDIPDTPLNSYRLSATPTNSVDDPDTNTWYVIIFALSNTTAQATTATLYLGDPYDTHIEFGGLGMPEGFVTQAMLDAADAAIYTTISNLYVPYTGAISNINVNDKTIIGGTATNSALLLQATTGAGVGTQPAFQVGVGNNGATKAITVTHDGKVGVNTATPDRILDLLDASNPQLRLSSTDGSVFTDIQRGTNDLIFTQTGDPGRFEFRSKVPTIRLYDSGDSLLVGFFGNGDNIFAGAGTGEFAIRGESKLHLGAHGNNLALTIVTNRVGIRTTTPSEALHVEGNAIITTNLTVGGHMRIGTWTNTIRESTATMALGSTKWNYTHLTNNVTFTDSNWMTPPDEITHDFDLADDITITWPENWMWRSAEVVTPGVTNITVTTYPSPWIGTNFVQGVGR